MNEPGNLMYANGMHLVRIQQLKDALIFIRKMVEADHYGVFLPLTEEDAQRIYDLCDEVISDPTYVPNISREFVNSDTSVTENKPCENCGGSTGNHRLGCNIYP